MRLDDIKNLKVGSYHKIRFNCTPPDIVITRIDYIKEHIRCSTYTLFDVLLLSGTIETRSYKIHDNNTGYDVIEPNIDFDKFKKENPEYFI